MTPAPIRSAALILALVAASASAATPQTDGPVEVRWRVDPESPRTGQVFTATVVVELDADWAEASLVQLFPQPLDVPLQVEGFVAERGALEWLGPAGFAVDAAPALDARARLSTVAVEGEVRAGVRTSPEPGVLRLEIRRVGRTPRAGEVRLAAPRVAYSAATAFREDLLRGRTPIDPVAATAEGEAVTFEVRALPEEGRPPEFSGAIGAFTVRAAGPDGPAHAGEPFTILATVEHDRALAPGVRPQLVAVPAALTVLGAVREDAAAAIANATAFRFSVVAAEEGDLALPEAELVAFDPARDEYVRHTASFGKVAVLPARAPADAGSGADATDGAGAPAGGGEGSRGGGSDLTWTLAVLGGLFGLAVLSVVRRRMGGRRIRGPLAGAHVAVFGRHRLDASTGESVAARSLVRKLRARGLRVSYVEPGDDPASLPTPPTICHAFHPGPAATLAADAAAGTGASLVVTVSCDTAELDDEARSNLKRADAVACTSAAQAEALARDGVTATRIGQAIDVDLIDLANGYADEEVLRGRVGREAPDTAVAVLLGGLSSAARIDDALDAFSELARRRAPEAQRWHLAVFGEALDEDHAAALEARAEGLANVTVLPALPHGEALVALAAAAALVETGAGDGEPRAVLEAQALQVPVLARRGAGAAALVRDGVTGRLYDDARGLADALEMLLADPASAHRLREAGHAAARERADVAAELDAVVALYERALASGGPAAAKA